MSGNVCEWVNELYGDYSADAQTNPQGHPTGQYGPYRVLRGGSWDYDSNGVRSSLRGDNTPDHSSYLIGFRASRTP